jgi:predicted GIY-YIG superfamily endonuclease
MVFYTYILKCIDRSFYVGHTDDLEQRLAQHQSGKFEGYTSARLPIEMVWVGAFGSRYDAFLAERKIKGWSRKKKEALIRKDWQTISELSKNRQGERQGPLESFDRLRTSGGERHKRVLADLVQTGKP